MKNSGIYIIKNLVNGKFYLGSSKDIQKRKSTHFNYLKKNKHHCDHLQRSYNKYGKENFEFIIIFNCYPEDCLVFENIFLNQFKPHYNTSKDAIAPMLGRKHNEITIEKMKNKQVKRGIEHHNYGKKSSDSTKEKQRLKRLGTKRSEETKQKMRETAKRINSISRIDHEKTKRKIIDSDGIIYNSLTDAAEKHNITPMTVCDILKGRHTQTRKKKSFKYYE